MLLLKKIKTRFMAQRKSLNHHGTKTGSGIVLSGYHLQVTVEQKKKKKQLMETTETAKKESDGKRQTGLDS